VILSPGSNNFVLENDFGSVVPPKDLNAITEAINKWLSMTDREREEFSQRAAKYMQEHKSIDAAISERFKLWSEKLAENHYNNK